MRRGIIQVLRLADDLPPLADSQGDIKILLSNEQ